MLPDLEKYKSALRAAKKKKAVRRAEWHDYSCKCIYMVTVMKMPGIPNFSIVEGKVSGNVVTAKAVPTRMGNHIARALKDLPLKFREYRTLQYVMMPDHIHILMEIMTPADYKLNELVMAFKNDCTRRYRHILSNEFDSEFRGNVFDYGFHDRILMHKDQLTGLFAYIRDNPRRLYLRMSCPEYFRTVLMCVADDKEFSIYGNLNLLEHPDKKVVRYSSKFTEEKRRIDRQIWCETIRSGGVLVSPFIHRCEDEYLELAIQNGGKAIVIMENGFHNRWKPGKRYIDACADGRLLFIGPKEYSYARIHIDRQMCMRLNSVAEMIASLPPRSYRLRRLSQ